MVSQHGVVVPMTGSRRPRPSRDVCRRVQVAELHSRSALGSLGPWSQERPNNHFSTRAQDDKDGADVDALLVDGSTARALGSRAVASIFGVIAAPPAGGPGVGILSPGADHRIECHGGEKQKGCMQEM